MSETPDYAKMAAQFDEFLRPSGDCLDDETDGGWVKWTFEHAPAILSALRICAEAQETEAKVQERGAVYVAFERARVIAAMRLAAKAQETKARSSSEAVPVKKSGRDTVEEGRRADDPCSRVGSSPTNLAQETEAAVEAEREACAKIAADGCLVPPDGGSPTDDEIRMCDNIAAAIRARKEPT